MAYQTPNHGLYVWDLETDQFNHIQLKTNWDVVDGRLLANSNTKGVETLAAVPGSGNYNGRLVMLSAADSGFAAWTLIRYDGAAWRSTSAVEISSIIPVSGNYAGRVVVLSAAVGGFAAWDVIRYDGSQWNVLGAWKTVNTGAGALNIKGVQLSDDQDAYIPDSDRGLVLVDRVDGTKHRLYISDNAVYTEIVT
jgi:hypothetical protein